MWIGKELVDEERPELTVTGLDPNQPLPDDLRDGFQDVCRQVDQHHPHYLEGAVWVLLAASKMKPTDHRCLRWLYAISRGVCVQHHTTTRCTRNYRMPRLCEVECKRMRAIARELRLCLRDVTQAAGASFLSLNDMKSIAAHRHICAVAGVVCKLVYAVEHSSECACSDRLRPRPELDGLTFVVFRLSPRAVARDNNCWLMGPLPARPDPAVQAQQGVLTVDGAIKVLQGTWKVDDAMDVLCTALDTELGTAVMYTEAPFFLHTFTALRVHQVVSSATLLGAADVVSANLLAHVLANFWEIVAPHTRLYLAQYRLILSAAADLLTLCQRAGDRDYWVGLQERRLRDPHASYKDVLAAIMDQVVQFETAMLHCCSSVEQGARQQGCGAHATHMFLSDVVAHTFWHYSHRWPSTSPDRWYEREHRLFQARHAHRRLPGVRAPNIETVPIKEWPTQLPQFLGKVLHLKCLELFCPPLLDMVGVNEPAPGFEFLVDCVFYSRTQHACVTVQLSLKPLRLLNLPLLTQFFETRTRFARLPKRGLYEPTDFEDADEPIDEELW